MIKTFKFMLQVWRVNRMKARLKRMHREFIDYNEKLKLEVKVFDKMLGDIRE